MGSRGAQPGRPCRRRRRSSSFNTWARGEPNRRVRPVDPVVQVSIHGLAGSPTCALASFAGSTCAFQYMGSRGAQPMLPRMFSREWLFQYMGSRGAQPFEAALFRIRQRVSIHGLAGSPTGSRPAGTRRAPVSIHGLAGSPTGPDRALDFLCAVSIHGLAGSPTACAVSSAVSA